MKAKHWMRLTVAAGLMVTLAASSALANGSDAWTTAKVKMALIGAKATGGTHIDVDTNDGHVTLSGKVPTRAEQVAAARIAARTKGVLSVRNLLQVVPGSRRKAIQDSDEHIKDSVADALEGEPALKNSDIDVKSVNSGVVILHGRAASLSDQMLAINVANDVPGTRRVISEIEGPKQYSDRELWEDRNADRKAINEERNDRNADRDNERNEPNDRTAQRDVHGYYPDNDRNNNDNDRNRTGNDRNDQRGSGVGDAWLTSRIKMSMMTDRLVPASDINVDTHRGVVTLFGTVPSSEAKARAEQIARHTGGVHDVRDELRVVNKSRASNLKRSDGSIASSVKKQLARAHMNGADVNVDVKARTVRLTGSVERRADAFHAVEIAYRTPGVEHVVNDLEVNNRAATRY